MSKDSVIRLFETARSNEALWKELDAAAQPENVVNIGAANGFDFTAAELSEVIDQMKLGAQELGDTELDRVAGGIGDIKGELKGIHGLKGEHIGRFTTNGFLGFSFGSDKYMGG